MAARRRGAGAAYQRYRHFGFSVPASRRQRLLLAATVASCGLLAASCASWGITTYAVGRLDKVDAGTAEAPPKGPLNLLLAGVDRRENLSRKLQRSLRLGKAEGNRSDTLMLIHLSAAHDKVTVVSLPRDSWVEIPGHGMHKINAAYGLGGPKLAVKTVQAATGLKIHHYIEVNVLGFIQVVDALGGVDICLDRPVNDDKSGLNLPAGRHHVNGMTALAYARTRASPRGDLDRIDRQQQLLSALLDRGLSAGTLTDPGKLTGFVNAVLDSVSVDKGLTSGKIQALANQMKGLSTDDVAFATVPIARAHWLTPTGESAVLWDDKPARELFTAIATDQRLVQPTPPQPPRTTPTGQRLTISPAKIAVRVLNGTPLAGHGSKARADLLRVGFLVPTSARNAPRTDFADTVVQYGRNRADSARTVAAAIPGAKMQLVPTLGRRVQVVVGTSYRGTQPVTVAGSNPPNTPATKPLAHTASQTRAICG